LNVERCNENNFITFQLAKVEIPISDIKDAALDDTYGGIDKEAIRNGTPFSTTDRVFIQQKQQLSLVHDKLYGDYEYN
jgi:hypothetical protein